MRFETLAKPIWQEEDDVELQKVLASLAEPQKVERSRKIINTQMPMLAITAPNITLVAKAIARGNYRSFLDCNFWDNYETVAINGSLICKIKNLDVAARYLSDYAARVDNWAHCDIIDIPANGREQQILDLVQDFCAASEPFKRRISVRLLFQFADKPQYAKTIFDTLDGFESETEYYVNMICAWLAAECFVKQREATLKWLENNKLNSFTVNKAVQKCRDSFRVSPEDKEMLLKFKRK